MKMSGRQSNTVGALSQSVSTRSWISEVDTIWKVSASRPDDVATLSTMSSSSEYSRVPFERGKDFREDHPDARSSHPDVNLIKMELRCF
jgi:hypothetical protein